MRNVNPSDAICFFLFAQYSFLVRSLVETLASASTIEPKTCAKPTKLHTPETDRTIHYLVAKVRLETLGKRKKERVSGITARDV